MIIVGTDKQQSRSRSKYPFTQQSACSLQIALFQPSFIQSIVLYHRKQYSYPIRISKMSIAIDQLIIQFSDATSVLGQCHVTEDSTTSIIASQDGLPIGILQVASQLYSRVYPLVKYGHGGQFIPSSDDFILDPITYIPYRTLGVQTIYVASNPVSTGNAQLIFADNIVLQKDDAGVISINAYSYMPQAKGIIAGLKIGDATYSLINKHIIITCKPQSDIRVVTQSSIISLVRACDV